MDGLLVRLPVHFLFIFNVHQQSKLQAEGIDNEAGLDEVIKKLEADLKKARKKEAGEVDDGPVRSPSHHLTSPNIYVTRPTARRALLPTRRRPRRRRTSLLPLLTASNSTRPI